MPTAAAADPIEEFRSWLGAAAAAGEAESGTAMTLATADRAGRPSARIVLLKAVDASGFRFFTNRDSRKGAELGANPSAALCFHWPRLERQVRVEGTVALLADAEARFAGREVERPPFWGGYLLAPERIEFWSGRANRLHERLLYTRANTGWTTARLYP